MAKPRKRRTSEQLLKDDALIFIDTNIFLDFYRMNTITTHGTKWLSQIENNLDRIITTCQVEMEFKKNRQNVILETRKNFKIPDFGTLKIPPTLTDKQAATALEKCKREIKQNVNKLNREIVSLIQHPSKKDPIYKTLEMLFQYKGNHVLGREHEERRKIKHKARTRYSLGYPPRKSADTSCGDALNWEWILWCAKQSKNPIIIVSRDSDYGHELNGSCILNSWLEEEFKDRIALKRPIILTNRLATGFKKAGISLPKKAVQEEEEMIAHQHEIDTDKTTSGNATEEDIPQ